MIASINVHTIYNSFLRNSANEQQGQGGAIYVNNVYDLEIINTTFLYSSVETGGRIYCNNLKRFRTRISQFYHNIAQKAGGGLYIETSIMITSFNNIYCENRGVTGGAMKVKKCGKITNFNNQYIKIYAEEKGAAVLIEVVISVYTRNCNFVKNKATSDTRD